MRGSERGGEGGGKGVGDRDRVEWIRRKVRGEHKVTNKFQNSISKPATYANHCHHHCPVSHLWDVRTMDFPLCTSLVRASHRLRRVVGSIPVVGSSCMGIEIMYVCTYVHMSLRFLQTHNKHSKYNLRIYHDRPAY